MNKHLLLICFLIVSMEGISQSYIPMLDSVNVWSYTYNYMPVAPPPHLIQLTDCYYPQSPGVARHTTGDDTLVHSISYKKLYYNYDFSQCLFGFIREDTSQRKVFFQDVLDSPEVVLYNFSMQLGDSIFIDFKANNWDPYWPTGTYRLDSINSVTTFSGIRNAYHLNCVTQFSDHTLTWIEGIGNLGDLVYPYSVNFGGELFNMIGCPGFPHDFDQFLTCFEHADKVYFDSCAYQIAVDNWCFNVQDSCNYWNICGDVDELSRENEILIYPNPAKDYIEIITSLKIEEANIFDAIGNTIFSIQPKNTQYKNFDVSMLECGIYFVEIRNGNKNFKSMFVKQ